MNNDRFSDALLEQIKDAVTITDLVGQYVAWDQKKSFPGKGDMWANCPFHAENSPSFHATDSKGIYHCFGCGVSGDHFQFLVEHAGMSFPEAVSVVAELAGIALPSARPSEPREVKVPEQPRQERGRALPSSAEGRRELVKSYDYTDRDGNLLWQVCRFQIRMPDGSFAKTKDGTGTWKTFLQRRPSGLGDGSWIWGLGAGEFMRPGPGKDWSAYDLKKKEGWPTAEVRYFAQGADHTIYRHPAVEIAIAEGLPIIIVEGEKDAETSVDLGFCGTTNSSGAAHWTAVHGSHFKDADVIIAIDNDAAGDRADKLAATMYGQARRIRVLDIARHVADFRKGGDITDWVKDYGGTAEALRAIIEGLPDWAPLPPKSAFGAKRTTQIANVPIIYDWLIKGLIERTGILMFAGERQSAKTFAAMDMGMKIARGLPYCGRKTRQGLVIHMACEDGKGVQMRAEGYRRKHNISAEIDVPYLVMDPEAPGADRFSLMSDESTDKFIAECLTWRDWFGMPLELIIIDTFSKATEGLNEIDGGEVGKVLGRADRIRLKTGATVALVHHMNASGNRMRGHGSLGDNVPNVIEIRPLMTIPKTKMESPAPVLDGDGRVIRQLTLAKNKNGLNNVKWRLVLEVVDLGEDADGDRITTCVCVPPTKSERSAVDDAPTLSSDQKLVYDALRAALEDSGHPMPPGVRAGSQIRQCAPNPVFIAYVRKQLVFQAPEDDAAARNKELTAFLKRTTTSLINAGYMGRDGDLKIVWWTGKSDRPTPRRRPDDAPPYEPPGAGIPEEVRREVASLETPF